MASTHKSLRSSTASKRPTTSIADGQIALNTNAASPGLFFKDSAGTDIIKVGPVHVGTTAPNATPAAGGSSGNSKGEVWLDTSLTPVGVKIWDGSAWQNATPAGSTTVQGLLELATNTETQTGTDTARAVTPAGLQSKVSDSTSTTSSTTIASSTAVKSAYDLADAALPKSGGIVTGTLEIGSTGSLRFEGATADNFETTLAVTDPTADRTVTIPNQTGNFLISGNASIVNADVNASAAIVGTKISPNFGSQTIQTTGVISHALGTAGAPTITFTGDTDTGVYSPGANQVAISISATERARIDSSGRLLLGESSAWATGDADLLAIQSQFGGNVDLRRDDASVVAGNQLGAIRFWGNAGDSGEAARIESEADGAHATGDKPGRLIFLTTPGGTATPVAAMRIDSDGIIYTKNAIGGTFNASIGTDLRISTFAASDTGGVGIESTTTSTGNRFHISFSNPNGVVGSIRTNGTATSYLTSSDYRLKENVTSVTDGIDRLKQLKPSRFNFIADPSVTFDGFLAHEVQDVIPEAISGEKDEVQIWEEGEKLPEGVSVGDTKLDENGDPIPSYQGIDQSKLVPLLTAALQEAVAKIETLEARLNAAGL